MNARQFPSVMQAIGAAVALLVIAAPAWADDPIRGDALCTDSVAANVAAPLFVNPSYQVCSAHYQEGPAPTSTLNAPFAGFGDFAFVGQTRKDDTAASTGPFDPFGPGFTFGTLSLKTSQTVPFVIALSSAGDYSLYLYDPGKAGGGAVSSLYVSTDGTTNIIRGPFELEYANLYTQAIPEPSSIALTLAGLAATGLAVRRRKA